MQFFNTMSRKKEEFVPLTEGLATMYCCGPTVYNYAHIGNLRTYVFEDVLRRALRFNGFQVKHVMNITDVGHLESDEDEGEDKMEVGAEREGLTVWEIARKYEGFWLADMALLNIEHPEVICRATEHVPEMIALIERILEHGCGYITPGAIYFDTSRFPNYAQLIGELGLSGNKAGGGGRVQLLGEKRHPNDFVLWFLNKPRHLMQWDSPWGRGYPGWHIECSAMSMKYLGETFDIHCGGVDHITVHHTNEIAQSECATGKKFVRYWLHGEFLLTEQEKMSKSADNFLTLKVVREKGYSPLAYRYLLMQAHYRSELKFSWETLEAARNGLRKVYGVRPENDPLADESKYAAARSEALDALNDDLNMPQLVGTLNRWNSYRLWTEFDAVLGLDISAHALRAEEALPADVQALVEERNEARKSREWARSDEIRIRLQEMGYEVGDSPQGTTVKKHIV